MLKILIFIFILTSCSVVQKNLSHHTIAKSETWLALSTGPLEKRVTDSSKVFQIEIKDFISKWKKEYQISFDTEHRVKLDKKIEIKNINTAITLLPKILYDYLNKKVLTIISVEDLNVPVAVYPVSGTKKYIVFLDERINALGLNDWYLWREYSGFKVKDDSVQIETFLSHTNSSIDTIHFVLSQTVGLILSWDPKFYPKELEEIKNKPYPVISRSWKWNKGILSSHHEKYFEDIKYLSFYDRSARSFSDDKLYEFYQILEKTNFPTLYSSTGPLRDFVDSLALYIHTTYFRRPYNIDFYRNQILLDSFSNCLRLPRCYKKNNDIKELLEKILTN